jgi:hypothetical protein
MADSVSLVLRKSKSYQVGEPAVIFHKDVPKMVHTDKNGTASEKADYLLSQRNGKGEPYFEMAPTRNRAKRSVFSGIDLPSGKRSKSKAKARKISGIEIEGRKLRIRRSSKVLTCAHKGCRNPAMDRSKWCPVHAAVN